MFGHVWSQDLWPAWFSSIAYQKLGPCDLYLGRYWSKYVKNRSFWHVCIFWWHVLSCLVMWSFAVLIIIDSGKIHLHTKNYGNHIKLCQNRLFWAILVSRLVSFVNSRMLQSSPKCYEVDSMTVMELAFHHIMLLSWPKHYGVDSYRVDVSSHKVTELT